MITHRPLARRRSGHTAWSGEYPVRAHAVHRKLDRSTDSRLLFLRLSPAAGWDFVPSVIGSLFLKTVLRCHPLIYNLSILFSDHADEELLQFSVHFDPV